MKILLVQPPKSPKTIGGEDVFIYEPLALEYVAAGVDRDHEIRILDLRLESTFDETLAEFAPDIVGLTAYTVHVNVVKELCTRIKEWNEKALTVVGGHHATIRPEDFASPHIDIVVVGEGVFSFREIIRRSVEGKSLKEIPGTVILQDDRMSRTDADPSVDLDTLPFPNRNLTKKYRSRYYSEWMKPLASIRTSKGCPFRCSFCAEWKVAGGRYFKRDPIHIVKELQQIEEPYVFFADDESLVDAPRMTRLAHLIRQAGIQKKYFLYGRSDTIVRHPELLRLWREIGLERIFIGLEFCREEDLLYIRKNSSVEDNGKAIDILRALGVEVYASFIVRPDASLSDFAAYHDYCQRMKLSYATFAVLTPLPGTDLYEETESQLLTRDYDFFDFIHVLLPTKLPLRDFYAELGHLYQRAIPLWRQVLILRRFQARDIPQVMMTGRRFFKRLATAHQDYELSVTGSQKGPAAHC